MTSAPATSDAPFAIGNYTSAPLQLDMELRFTNQSPAAVFDVMGDPEQIQNWYVLAKDTVVDEQTAEKELQFEVDFILFGKVREEVMLWNPPQRYVYRAFGEHFPFRDYVASLRSKSKNPIPVYSGGSSSLPTSRAPTTSGSCLSFCRTSTRLACSGLPR